MAENDEIRETVGREPPPLTPAPTRSQANRQSRAPEIAAPLPIPPASTIPAVSDKPPPEEPEFARRRSDVIPTGLSPPDDDSSNRSETEESEDSSARIRRWRFCAAASWAALAIICVLAAVYRVPERIDLSALAPSRSAAQSEAHGANRDTGRAVELPPETDAAMKAALDDLNAALEAIPEESPEHILKQVSMPGQDCMLAWTNNLPSVIFGKEPIRPNSLARTLEGCAESVWRLARRRNGLTSD